MSAFRPRNHLTATSTAVTTFAAKRQRAVTRQRLRAERHRQQRGADWQWLYDSAEVDPTHTDEWWAYLRCERLPLPLPFPLPFTHLRAFAFHRRPLRQRDTHFFCLRLKTPPFLQIDLHFLCLRE